MRIAALVFLLFLFVTPAFAAEEGLERACPHGFSVINGKCTPPCPEGERRSLSGRCTAIRCSMGQELVGSACKIKCTPPKKRDADTGKCVAP